MRIRSKTCAAVIPIYLLIYVIGGLSYPAFSFALDWSICKPFQKRYTCIVDGDTLWYQGEKMRLYGVDTPELNGKCHKERHTAQLATTHLQSLLTTGIINIRRHGHDRYGRSLVTIKTNAGQVERSLLQYGLAERYGYGQQINWCR